MTEPPDPTADPSPGSPPADQDRSSQSSVRRGLVYFGLADDEPADELGPTTEPTWLTLVRICPPLAAAFACAHLVDADDNFLKLLALAVGSTVVWVTGLELVWKVRRSEYASPRPATRRLLDTAYGLTLAAICFWVAGDYDERYPALLAWVLAPLWIRATLRVLRRGRPQARPDTPDSSASPRRDRTQ